MYTNTRMVKHNALQSTKSARRGRGRKRRLTTIPRSSYKGAEIKATIALASAAVDTSTGAACLSYLAKGDEYNQRIGRQVHIHGIDVAMTNQITLTTGGRQVHRVLLILARWTEGAAVVYPNDVMTSTNVLANRLIRDYDYYEVLWDKLMVLGSPSESNERVANSFSIPLNIIEKFNDGSAGTYADIQQNSLWLIWAGDQAAGAAAGTISYHTQIYFTDR